MHAVSSHTLFDYVKELASPRYQGRLTGTPGYDAAARWCAQFLNDWKIKPAGDNGTYEQHFPNPYTLVLPGARLSLRVPISATEFIEKTYAYEDDYFPGSTSDSGTVTAEVVYVGYGITAPELGYDDYAGMDVKGKLVLVEPEVPTLSIADKEPDLFKKWRPYSFHDYKVQNAAKHGAAGMIYNYHIANPNCVFVKGFLLTYVGRPVVNDVFAGTGKNHDELVKSIVANRKPVSFETKKTMTVKNVTEHHPEGIGSNVIGILEGTDPELKNEPIIIGAHLDHLGLNDQLMPGANDNASADAVLLGVAEALAKPGIPLKRSVIFILFGAEEQGVKGSEWYVNHPIVPNAKVKGMINLESVGRGETISGGSGRNYPDLWAYFERNNTKYIHRQVRTTQNANLARPRQDAAHFMWAGIPTISFGTGGGRQVPVATYHTTHDTIEWITPEIMEDLARLVYLAVVEMASK
jgi:Zn-dependent M28 family amino/carboxypeptidase